MTDDVIGPIYSGYVPFHPWKSGCATAFSYVEVARLEEPIQVVGINVWSVNGNLFYRAWKEASFGGDRTAVPSDNEILWSERSTTELAGPGYLPLICKLFFVLRSWAQTSSHNCGLVALCIPNVQRFGSHMWWPRETLRKKMVHFPGCFWGCRNWAGLCGWWG